MKKNVYIVSIMVTAVSVLTACGGMQDKAQGKWKLDYGDNTASYIQIKDDKMNLENKGVLSETTKLQNIKDNSFEFDIKGIKGTGHAKATVNNDKDKMKVKLNNVKKPVTYEKVED